MGRPIFATLITALPSLAVAASAWLPISSEQGKRIELDKSSIQKAVDGKVTARARLLLDKDLVENRTGGSYRSIETITRYDCTGRNAANVKRTFLTARSEVVHEEEGKGLLAVPVRTGTLDDKVLREVCRPGGAKGLAEKATESATDLRKANEALVAKEVAREGKVMKASTGADHHPDPGDPAPAMARRAAARAKPAARPAPIIYETPSPAVHAHAHIHWGYEGPGAPERWAELDPKNKVCALGDRQSPIDIREGIKVDLEPIQFSYKPSQFRVVDNGHTIQVAVGDGSLTVTGKTYDLIQFHFHRPSEERINGKYFDMVAHLVHRSDDGKLAVVAVLMERGPENPFIQTIWNNLPLDKNIDVAPTNATLDLNAFLPTSRSYFTYMGSLTTPPCTEGVLWMVMKQPVSISPEQVAIFSRLYRNNARPIQPAAGRLIKESR